MSLVVENGSGLSNAESYVFVVDCDAYHVAHGNTPTGITVTDKEIALRLATQYLEARYVGQWIGTRINSTMSLSWPRFNAEDPDGYWIESNIIPQRLKDATCELALRKIQGDTLVADISEPGTVSAESVTVGPISTSTSYTGGKSQTKQYSIVDRLIGPLIESGSRLVRA